MHVLLDLNGTLLDAGAMGAGWPGGRDTALRALDDAVWQAGVDTATGGHRPFPDYLKAAFDRLSVVHAAKPSLVDDALTAAQALPSVEDAAEALEALRAGGLTAHVLTNSGAEAAEAALTAAGLRGHVDRVIGCDAVGAYKPDPRPYRHALEQLGARAEATWLVSAHWWDVFGAGRAGLRTAWVGRDERALLLTVPTPDAASATLAGAAARVVELSARTDG